MASMTWEELLVTVDNPSADITTIAAVARLFTAAQPDGVGLSSPAQAAGLQKTTWRGFQWPHWLARDTDSLQIKRVGDSSASVDFGAIGGICCCIGAIAAQRTPRNGS